MNRVLVVLATIAAMLGRHAYALLAEDTYLLIPLATAEPFAICVVAAVVLAELFKNALYGTTSEVNALSRPSRVVIARFPGSLEPSLRDRRKTDPGPQP